MAMTRAVAGDNAIAPKLMPLELKSARGRKSPTITGRERAPLRQKMNPMWWFMNSAEQTVDKAPRATVRPASRAACNQAGVKSSPSGSVTAKRNCTAPTVRSHRWSEASATILQC